MDVYLKPDPDATGASPAVTEDDIYEDTGDLEFNTDPDYEVLYLARIPKYLWQTWANLDDDTEINLGTIRITRDPVTGKDNMGILLRPDLPFHKEVPKEYEADLSKMSTKNTYIFSEQDLPGFKSKTKQKFNLASANMPARLTRPQQERADRGKFDKDKQRFTPYVKKIPKKTTLVGTVKHEVNCAPVVNAESERILAERTLEALKPKSLTARAENVNQLSSGYLHQGTAAANSSFGSFIKTGKAVKQDNRVARIQRNALFDRIFSVFRQFKYCSMKVMRERVLQPEAYIREALEEIADLSKSGPFAMNWSLKPENLKGLDAAYADANGVAPGGPEGVEDSDMGDIDDDDDDDDDVKMEDVL